MWSSSSQVRDWPWMAWMICAERMRSRERTAAVTQRLVRADEGAGVRGIGREGMICHGSGKRHEWGWPSGRAGRILDGTMALYRVCGLGGLLWAGMAFGLPMTAAQQPTDPDTGTVAG